MNVTFSITEGKIINNYETAKKSIGKRNSKRFSKMNRIDENENDQYFNNLI